MVSKFTSLLDMFAMEKPVWRQAELARQLDVPASTLSRNLATLTGFGHLQHDAAPGTYSLGPKLVQLAGTTDCVLARMGYIPRPIGATALG